jgi:hypothetical protein
MLRWGLAYLGLVMLGPDASVRFADVALCWVRYGTVL